MFESFVPQHLTDSLWLRLANTRLFITGGTGLFGHWVLDSLTEANQRLNLKIEATVLTRNPNLAITKMPNLDKRISFLKGDVGNFLFTSEKFDYILHMATTSANETFQGYSQTNKVQMLFEGTKRVIELAHNSGAKRILFTSSGAVYGNQSYDNIEESSAMHIDPLKAESGLAIGKCGAEFLLSQACVETDLDVVIARCFTFVGPGMPMNLHYAIGNFIFNAAKGKPIIIKGDGTAIRSYMYMGDLIWWLLKLLLDGKSGEAYNVGSDQPITIKSLAQTIANLCNSKSEIIVQGQSDYSVGLPVRNLYVPSIKKAQENFQLKINTDIKSAIIYTYNTLL
jgi:dTDP-glucose 4,6-dehydratase/UDP-glucose 4-epimerase